MKKIKFSKKEYKIAKFLVVRLVQEMRKKHPKLKALDSNIIHFMISNVTKKQKIKLSGGWFKHGPYFPVVDDVLIDLGWMKESEHQLYGDEKPMEEWIKCDCHKLNTPKHRIKN